MPERGQSLLVATHFAAESLTYSRQGNLLCKPLLFPSRCLMLHIQRIPFRSQYEATHMISEDSLRAV